MKTIKDEVLKKEIDNLINRVMFAKFYQDVEIQSRENEIKEAKLFLELLEGMIESNKELFDKGYIAKTILSQVKQLIEEQNEKSIRKENGYIIENALYDEIITKFNELPNGYRTYDVEYFNDRMNIFRVSGLTFDLTQNELNIQEQTGFIKTK